jgi:hypothetical protein
MIYSEVTYLASGGIVGDTVKAEVTCDKCMAFPGYLVSCALDLTLYSRQDVSIYGDQVHEW